MTYSTRDLTAVRDQIDSDIDEHVKRIQQAIRQPSLSVDDIGLRKISEFVVDLFDELGCDEAELVETDGAPGAWGYYDAGAEKTVVTYGMLDTQLVLDEDKWKYGPFTGERTEIEPYGEVIVGRITAKGAFVAYLNALMAAREVHGELPVNVVFLAETEELNGSPHYYDMLEKYEDRIQEANACYGPGFAQNNTGDVTAPLGYKSGLYFDLEVSGDKWGYGPQGADVHAMSNAILDSPAWRLVEAMSSLVEDNGRSIAIDGYYDQYEPPTRAEREEVEQYVEALDGEEDLWKSAPGLGQGLGTVERLKDDLQEEGVLETFIESFYGPNSFNIQGIRCGFLGPNTNTLPFRLPHQGSATFDIRMPRGYDPAVVLAQLRSHLDDEGFEDIEIRTFGVHRWSRTERDSDLVVAVEDVLRSTDVRVTFAPYTGAGVPWAAFKSRYNIPVVHGIGLGYQGTDGTHEFISIDGNETVSGLVDAELSFIEILAAYADS